MKLLRGLFYGSALMLCINATGVGQITQDKPELCGPKNQPVPLPSSISATQADTGTFSTLFLKTGASQAPVAIQVTMGSVEEVCPISGDRFLIFGDSNPAKSVVIVDRKGTKLTDSFFAYDPAVSPNQHWLAMRDFYPPQSEMSMSEEYLIYDLTKDRAGNRLSNPDPSLEAVGYVIYPAVANGIPFIHGGLPENQTHQFRSDAFYWSDDSRTLVFADSMQKDLSVVMVAIDGDQIRASLHKVIPAEACQQGSEGDINASHLTLSHAEINSNGVELQFRSNDYGACKPISFAVAPGEFVPAKVESHVPPQRKDVSTMKPTAS